MRDSLLERDEVLLVLIVHFTVSHVGDVHHCRGGERETLRPIGERPGSGGPSGLTGHAEGSPQSSSLLLALFELHAAHPDDLAHQEEAWPHQVAAAQVLDAQPGVKLRPTRKCSPPPFLQVP